MSYSGAVQAKQARELLGNALATLQQDTSVPPQVGTIVSYMAQAVGSLFAAEYAATNADGRAAVRAALGLLGQAIAAIQQIEHPAVQIATGALAQAMGLLFPLTTVPDTLQPEPAPFLAAPAPAAPAQAPAPVFAAPAPAPEPTPVFAAPAPAPAPEPEPAKPIAKQTLLMATLPTQNELIALHKSAAAEAPSQPIAPQPTFTAQPSAAQPVVTLTMESPAAPVAAPAKQAGSPEPTPHGFDSAPAGFQQPPQSFQQPPQSFQPAPQSFQPAAQSFQPAPQALAPAPPPTKDSFAAASTVPASQAQFSPQPAPRSAAMSAEQVRAANASYSAAQNDGRKTVEANVGLTTESNFWVGFDDDIGHGGVFLPTYAPLPEGTRVMLQVTLPAGGMFACPAHVRYVRDSLEYSSEMQPGMGLQFDALLPEHRDLAQRFMEKRRALFFDEA